MSAILSADDLNDFISPGVACIKPVESLSQKSAKDAENPYEVTTEEKVEPENLPPAQISLTDCLACSGCVTSAEAVLISLQSHTEVLNTLDAHPEIPLPHEHHGRTTANPEQTGEGRIFVASVSPQVRASLAATYGISEKEAGYMIDQFLCGPQGLRGGGKHGSGFTWVVDTNVMREAVLVLTADEVSESFGSDPAGNSPSGAENALPKRPILSSACPGWICYAEKTHPFVLPHLSRLKSPQALSGTFLKTVLSKSLGVPASRIWHLALMPCFDKKLEASREELTDASWQQGEFHGGSEPVRDVDCVITTRELLSLAAARGFSLPNIPLQPLPSGYIPPFPEKSLDSFISFKRSPAQQSLETGTSGGYLHHVLNTFQARHPGSQLVTNRGRNADVVEYVLTSPEGQPIMKAARYYGFRNIQNLVRKLKPARASRMPGAKPVAAGRRQPMSRNTVSGTSGSDFAYVEVMACPGGCTNGGGQIRVEDAREAINSSEDVQMADAPGTSTKPSPHEQRAWLARVDEAYFSMESDSENETSPHSQLSIADKEALIHQGLARWSEFMGISLDKLVYTTYRKVESDVGKEQAPTNGTANVVELAGKIGGGW
ncbi:Iron hydrogenase [Penicillium cinerascens]|uniref:Cytosolic Fe-S cluster assembly factor NAR1 n=1 Tax=Penicillium cinerascens TaxID=70096 RepID=A0A9W9M5U1_9EURO|nr:Iron hydrogenase [Penicillium cinerascens]KAJ5190826.1 Iron hydrogenase [Penicillium cinerascens]